MISIIWKCDTCGREKKTKAKFDCCQINENDIYSPEGWQAFIKENKLLCPACHKTACEAWRKKNPDAILMA